MHSLQRFLLQGLSFLILFSPVLHAQLTRREFVVPDRSADDRLGSSVTATALYTIAGVPLDDTAAGLNAGSVAVFHAATGRLHRRLFAPAGDAFTEARFGSAVAASGDFLVVGAVNDPAFGASGGAAYLFRLSTGAFIRKLGAGLVLPGDSFGSSVAIWGNYIVVGAPNAEAGGGAEINAGQAFLFTLDNSVPPAVLPTLAVIPGGSSFGVSVAFDNHRIAVGAPNATFGGLPQTGIVYMFAIHPVTGVAQEVKQLVPSDAAASDGFGWAVALHGNALAVGSPFRTVSGSVDAGRVILYPNVARDIAGFGSSPFAPTTGFAPSQFYGLAVALGDTLLASGTSLVDFAGTDAGSISVFGYAGGTHPADPESSLVAQPPVYQDNQNYGAAVAAFGNRLVVGAPGDNTQGVASAGSVHQAQPLRTALANSTYNPILRLGSSAPGAGGAVFTGFSEAIGTTSQTFVAAKLAGPEVTKANGKAVISQVGSGYSRLFRTGSTAAPGVVQDIFGLLPGSSSGVVQGMIRLGGSGTSAANNLAVFSHDGTALTSIVRLGDSLGPSLTVKRFFQVRASYGNIPAMVLGLRPAAPVVTAASDSALRAGTTLIQEGSASTFGPNYGQFSRVSVADQIIYPVALQGAGVTPSDNACLEMRNSFGGAATSIARKGTPAPAPGAIGVLAPFQSFLGEVTNAGGGYAFRATMALGAPAVTVANNEGLWANNGPGGALQLCVRKGDSIPAIPQVKFHRFLQFGVDSSPSPDLIFLAQLAGPGVKATNDLSLWAYRAISGELVQLLREGEHAPGNARGKIGVIQRVDIVPNLRTYTLLCSLTPESGGIGPENNQMLLVGYFGSAGGLGSVRPSPLLIKGQRYNRIGPDRIRSISFLTATNPTGALASGLGQAIDFSRVICQVQFSNTDKEVIQLQCNP